MVNSSMVREIGSSSDESRLTELARKLEVVLARIQGEEYAMASREARMKAVDAEIGEIKRDFSELQNAMASLARVIDELNVGARLNEQELRVEDAHRELKDKMKAVSELLDLVRDNSRKLRELEEKSFNIKVILGQLDDLSHGVQTLVDHLRVSESSLSELRSDVYSLKKLAGILPEAAAREQESVAAAVQASTMMPVQPSWTKLRDDLNGMIQNAHALLSAGRFDEAKAVYDSVLNLSRDFGVECTDRVERDAMNAALERLYTALVSTAKAKGKK